MQIGTKFTALKNNNFGIASLDEEMIQHTEQFTVKVLESLRIHCDMLKFG